MFFSTSSSASVMETLQTTIRTLKGDERYTTLEPISSTVHLFAMALQLPWDTGYNQLLQIVNQMESSNTNNNKNNESNVTVLSPSASLSSLANRIVTVEELQLFHSYLERRMIHQEPIQYICGQWDFLSSTFQIQPPLLCPRPETEELTMHAIKDIRTAMIQQQRQLQLLQQSSDDEISKPSFRVLDIGCGTGCIGISIAKEISQTVVTAIDIEPIAVQVSNRNAARIMAGNYQNRYMAHLIDIEQFGTQMKKLIHSQGNGTTDTENNLQYDMVVSNPPYILPSDMDTLEESVLKYESHTALNGGGTDGLDIIRTILQQLPYVANNNAICWIEIDPSQPKLIQDYVHTFNEHQKQLVSFEQCSILSNTEIVSNSTATATANTSNHAIKTNGIRFLETIKDMFGHDRFVKLQVIEL
jgi:release factor glutamine methyltransferase